MHIDYPEGATPLDPDEAEGLRLTHITTREQLNIFEAENIRRAAEQAFTARVSDILSETFIRRLHREMFKSVWKWAGEFRKTNKNIGDVPREMIGIELRHLCDDVRFWIDDATFEPDEIATRFHHRLVFIHPFVNGNGRHARLITDLLLEKVLGRPRFSWGGAKLESQGKVRDAYIRALRAADRNDYAPLLDFVRS